MQIENDFGKSKTISVIFFFHGVKIEITFANNINYKTNKKMKKSYLIFMFLFFSAISLAQNSLHGVVTDDKNVPIPGVSVLVENSTKGTTTDFDGKFVLENLEAKNTTFIFSYIGFKTVKKQINVNGKTETKVSLKEDAMSLDDVIVTGVVNPRGKLQSSVSVSSVNIEQIDQAAPRSTAEIFRSIPGIKSESTGGEGNANLTVRGIPVASGGGKFLQLHEDGLPVMQFGDVAFGNADIFLRNDLTLSKIEAIRGGSASTVASNSPAGIINFISKDGSKEGGTIMQSFGLDFNNLRTDFEFGTPLSESIKMHVGGFYRQGEGPRTAGYTANLGGQIKANITKSFKNGYVKLYLKHLNDRAIGYLPMPVKVTGTNENPTWSSLSNFDILRDTPHSPLFLDNLTIGADGERRRSNIADGMRPIATSIGAEFSFDLGNDWKVENKMRKNFHEGRFVSPFPESIKTASAFATEFSVPNLTFANGTNAGKPLNANDLVMRVHLFDVEINNFGNFTNDMKLSKNFGDLKLTAGYYSATQNISMSWLWNSYLLEVKGDNAALVNAGANSTNGLLAYGVPAWGNCCQRNYDAVYTINAPYLAGQYQIDEKLNVDASIRFDSGTARGSYAGSKQSANLDVNLDGVIQGNETSVSVIDNAYRLPINYDFDYVSYSVGANYLLNENQSVFARHSRGGRANADRLLFGAAVLPSGAALSGLSADMVTQTEVGFKYRKSNFGVYATAFMANTSEQNWDFAGGAPREIQREYEAKGIELEANYKVNKFDVSGSVTWTDAKIKEDFFNPTFEGNTPRRQADFIYNVNASYLFGDEDMFAVGFSAIGTTKSFAQDDNKLIMPGYVFFNPFVRVELTKSLSTTFNANNIFNAIGITEVEEGSITANQDNILRARSINGRTISMSVIFKF
jgi:outer membrane receptor protein involved in Fe transport